MSTNAQLTGQDIACTVGTGLSELVTVTRLFSSRQQTSTETYCAFCLCVFELPLVHIPTWNVENVCVGFKAKSSQCICIACTLHWHILFSNLTPSSRDLHYLELLPVKGRIQIISTAPLRVLRPKPKWVGRRNQAFRNMIVQGAEADAHPVWATLQSKQLELYLLGRT